MAIKATLLSACVFGSAHGHMIMANPVPYSYETIDNSPLSSSNYPCKLTGDAKTFYATTGIDNTYAAGSTQMLSFKGSATHGGGSCQLALSSDMEPSVSTDWRVILSIEGGCPTTDLTGSSGASTYNWTVPESLTPGSYSFAWTWISKQAGQAEYYMNCAPITVTAPTASSKRGGTTAEEVSRREDVSYPELFVANLADINDCLTTEGSDYVYPFGGAVENLGTPADSLKYTTITSASCVPKGQTEGGNYLPTAVGAVATGSAVASSSAQATGAGGASASATSASTSVPGGVFLSSDASAPAATTFIVSTAVVAQTTTSETVYVSPVVQTTSTTSQAASATTVVSPSGGATGGGVTLATASSAQVTSSSSTLSSSSVLSSSPVLSSSTVLSSSSALPSSSTLSTTTVVSSTISALPTSSAAATTPSTVSTTPTVTGSGGAAATATGSSSGTTMSGTCTDEGEFNCIGSQYQQCASGAWTAMQALPAGTTCTQGLSMGLWARRVGPDGFRRLRRARRGGLY